MAPTVVLITGANRGLGEGLARRFLAQNDQTVIAACRDLSHSTTQALANLPRGSGTSLIVAKYDAGVESDAANLVNELASKHGISHLDIVVANAGIAKVYPSVKDLKHEDLREHLQVNVFGMLALYQATHALLKESQTPNKPIFAPLGSAAGRLSDTPKVTNAAYGPTKTAVHWYGGRINAEDEWLNCFVLDPGWAQTDMGNAGARAFGLEKALITAEESCDGMHKVLNSASKEKYGGKIVYYDGEIMPW